MSKSPESSTCTPAAAQQGDADAQFGLGIYLAAGTTTQDYTGAREWYQKAADQGHRLAQFNLGQMFAYGQGVPKSESMALMWIRRAADGGDCGAQYDMGERTSRLCTQCLAEELSEARIETYKWFTLASGQEYRDAQFRSDTSTMRMTREEVSEGNRRVKQFGDGAVR